jgi:hypothetical protein
MTQKISLLALTVVASAVVAAERFVTAAGAYPAPAGKALGVSQTQAAVGERFAADVLGTTVITAGAAIAVDQRVEVGANGKAVPLNAGVPVGVAVQAAAADGDRIEILLIPN